MVFAGTPDVAATSLSILLASRHDVLAVVTRPDAAAGRGRKPSTSPVAQLAAQRGITVLKPNRPGDPEFISALTALAPDICPVVAYGALVPPRALVIPEHGWVNLHFSLLPAWRGAAPVQHAILAGDDVTGASTFRLTEGLDTGPVYGVVTETISPTDTSGDVLTRLAVSGAQLLVATLDGIEADTIEARQQSTEGVSMAPKLAGADAQVRWNDPAVGVDRRIRACTPTPGPWTMFRGGRVKLGPVRVNTEASAQLLEPGQLVVAKKSIYVATGSDLVELTTVQAGGKRTMSASDWARGMRIETGDRFA